MRVLGVDPGLTRCGVGVVDGGPGRQPRLVEVLVVRTPPQADLPDRLLTVADAVEAMMDRHQPGHGGDRAGVQPAQRAHRDGYRAGVRRRRAGRRPARHPGGLAHPERGQGGGVRQRPRRQGPGHGHGHPAAAAAGRADVRRTPPTRWRWRICHLWRSPMQADGWPRPPGRRLSPRARQSRGTTLDDRLRPRHRAVRHARPRRHRGRRGRPGRPHHAVHPGRPASRGTGAAVDHAGGAGGLADPVRIRHRTRPRSCSSWSSRCPGSGPKIALALLAVLDPDELRRALAAGDTATLTRAPGHRPQGRRAARAGAARTRSGRSSRQPVRRPAWRGIGRPGAGQAGPTRWSGSGFTAKQADDAIAAVAADADDPAVANGDVGVLLRRALGLLGRSPVSAAAVSRRRYDADEPNDLASTPSRGARRRRSRGIPAAAVAARVRRSGAGPRTAGTGARPAAKLRGAAARPRPAGRAARAGQDVAWR